MKENYDFVFVILVYKNYEDLIKCLKSIKKHIFGLKVIIVNSYYDDYTYNKVKMIAERFGCDFINVENRGYSYGNNKGIIEATKRYDYKYIIVSNPDIIIKKFPLDYKQLSGDIIAPKIVTKSGKNQNPILPYDCLIADMFMYFGYKKRFLPLVYLGYAINKILRNIFLFIVKTNTKKPLKIYGAHGAFVIFSYNAIKNLGNCPYDDNMFLFEEEFVIAFRAKEKKLSTYYIPSIVIKHMEDGSISKSNISETSELGKSTIYYYQHYRRK